MAENLEKEELLKQVTTTRKALPMNRVSTRYSWLNVAGLTADIGACGYYRVVNPIHLLMQHGATVDYSSVQNITGLTNSDVIVAPRQCSTEVYDNLRRLQFEGKKVYYELDDDLHNVLRTSPAYSVYYRNSESLLAVEKFISSSHGLTVTTPELARAYARFNTNISIIENYIDFSLRNWNIDVDWNGETPVFKPLHIDRPKEWGDSIVLTWAGGATHMEDLIGVFPHIKRILEMYPKTMFAYYGAWELFEAANERAKIPLDRVFKITPRHFLDYPDGLRGDIGLAPIVPCQFNICKSALKITEYMAAGMAVVASNVGPYARFNRLYPDTVNLVGNGRNMHSTWVDAVGELVSNPDKLLERKVKGRQLALSRFSLENNFHLWPIAWNSMFEKAAKGLLGPPDVPFKFNPVTFGNVGRNDTCPCGSGLKYKACCLGAFG